jgi:hypothetical protein
MTQHVLLFAYSRQHAGGTAAEETKRSIIYKELILIYGSYPYFIDRGLISVKEATEPRAHSGQNYFESFTVAIMTYLSYIRYPQNQMVGKPKSVLIR